MKLLIVTFLFSFFESSCNKQEESSKHFESTKVQSKFTYPALGDSYTIGESLTPSKAFPYQLQVLLNNQKIDVAQPKIITRTGWTTGDLQSAIKHDSTIQRLLIPCVNIVFSVWLINLISKSFGKPLSELIALITVFRGRF